MPGEIIRPKWLSPGGYPNRQYAAAPAEPPARAIWRRKAGRSRRSGRKIRRPLIRGTAQSASEATPIIPLSGMTTARVRRQFGRKPPSRPVWGKGIKSGCEAGGFIRISHPDASTGHFVRGDERRIKSGRNVQISIAGTANPVVLLKVGGQQNPYNSWVFRTTCRIHR